MQFFIKFPYLIKNYNNDYKGKEIKQLMTEMHEYEIDKITFEVIAVYREDTTKTIHDILLNLMKKDKEND